MKTLTYSFGIILLTCSTWFCFGQNKVLDSILQPTKHGGDFTTTAYTYKDGLCSRNIFLHSDHTYTYEGGCESSSNVSVGRYSITDDKVIFAPFQKDEIKPFYSVEAYGESTANDEVSIIFEDREGHDLLKLMRFKGKNADVLNQRVLAYGQNRLIRFKKSEIDSIYFPKLYELTGRHFVIKPEFLPPLLMITANLSDQAFLYPHVGFSYEWRYGTLELAENYLADDQLHLYIKRE